MHDLLWVECPWKQASFFAVFPNWSGLSISLNQTSNPCTTSALLHTVHLLYIVEKLSAKWPVSANMSVAQVNPTTQHVDVVSMHHIQFYLSQFCSSAELCPTCGVLLTLTPPADRFWGALLVKCHPLTHRSTCIRTCQTCETRRMWALTRQRGTRRILPG